MSDFPVLFYNFNRDLLYFVLLTEKRYIRVNVRNHGTKILTMILEEERFTSVDALRSSGMREILL